MSKTSWKSVAGYDGHEQNTNPQSVVCIENLPRNFHGALVLPKPINKRLQFPKSSDLDRLRTK